MKDTKYKSFVIGYYFKNGTKQVFRNVEKDGKEIAHDFSTIKSAKNYIDSHHPQLTQR